MEQGKAEILQVRTVLDFCRLTGNRKKLGRLPPPGVIWSSHPMGANDRTPSTPSVVPVFIDGNRTSDHFLYSRIAQTRSQLDMVLSTNTLLQQKS